MPRGTLARMARERNLVSDIMLLEHKPNGYTEDELTSVRIVTLPEYAHECAIKQVALEATTGIKLVGASDEVTEVLKRNFSQLKEFVSIDADLSVLIAVDQPTINDEAIAYALRLLFKMEHVTPGSYEQFGEWIPLRWC